MKIKSLFILIIIIPIFTFPYVNGYYEFSNKDRVINDGNTLNGDDRIYVEFCYGKISGLYDFGCGYNHYIFYGFSAVDVICIINYTDEPLYHHLTGGEACAICHELGTPFPFHRFRGSVSDNFIYANHGILSPRIVLLIYYIQQLMLH